MSFEQTSNKSTAAIQVWTAALWQKLGDIAGGTMFIGLQTFYKKYGSPFKLCFGPKSFLVISDPVQARYLLRDASKTYDKVSKDFSFINHP